MALSGGPDSIGRLPATQPTASIGAAAGQVKPHLRAPCSGFHNDPETSEIGLIHSLVLGIYPPRMNAVTIGSASPRNVVAKFLTKSGVTAVKKIHVTTAAIPR